MLAGVLLLHQEGEAGRAAVRGALVEVLATTPAAPLVVVVLWYGWVYSQRASRRCWPGAVVAA